MTPNFEHTRERNKMLAAAGWFRRGYGTPTDEHYRAANALGIDLDRKDSLDIDLCSTSVFAQAQEAFRFANGDPGHRAIAALPTIRSALNSNTASTGGAIAAPSLMVETIEKSMLAFGGIISAADVIRLDYRGDIIFPLCDGTANTGRRLEDGGAINAASSPTFGQAVLHPYKYTSDQLIVPNEMLLDGTVVEIVMWIAGILGERIARVFGQQCTTGNGVSQPYGIVNRATTVSAASATTITHDDIDNLIMSVDSDYRASASFMMHDDVRLTLMKAKDADGGRLWPAGVSTLRGFPVVTSSDMASTISSGAKSVIFGNLRKYKIRMRPQFRITRLQQLHMLSDQSGFVAFGEMDGDLLDAGTHPVKVLTH